MAKEDYFIKMGNPRQIRRMLLENTREVLQVLQGYEDFRKVREKRSHLVNSFRNDLDNTKALVSELKRMLPKAGIKDVRKQVKTHETEKPVKEIKKIEQELADIEEKLSSL